MHIYPLNFTAGDRTPFTYFLRHRLTGKMYYGMRTAKGCKPEDLWTTYYTTSKIVKQIIKTDGANVFNVKVSRIFTSVNSCHQHETKFLERVDAANNLLWLNQHNSNGKFNTTGKIFSLKSIEKRAKSNRGQKRTAETKQKQSNSRMGCIPWNKGKTNIYSNETRNKIANSLRGHKQSQKTIDKRKSSQSYYTNEFSNKMKSINIGRIRMYHPEKKINKRILPTDLNYFQSLGFLKGFKKFTP